jgi:hypothetical protein
MRFYRKLMRYYKSIPSSELSAATMSIKSKGLKPNVITMTRKARGLTKKTTAKPKKEGPVTRSLRFASFDFLTTPPMPTFGQPSLLGDRVNIAGVQYSDYQQVDPDLFDAHLSSQEPLGLVWERTNSHDPKALALYVDNIRIGYIPRGHLQELIHAAHAKGAKVRVHLTGYHPTNPTYNMFVIKATAAYPLANSNDFANLKKHDLPL